MGIHSCDSDIFILMLGWFTKDTIHDGLFNNGYHKIFQCAYLLASINATEIPRSFASLTTHRVAGASGNRTQPGPFKPTAALKAEAPTRDTAAPFIVKLNIVNQTSIIKLKNTLFELKTPSCSDFNKN